MRGLFRLITQCSTADQPYMRVRVRAGYALLSYTYHAVYLFCMAPFQHMIVEIVLVIQMLRIDPTPQTDPPISTLYQTIIALAQG